MSCSYSRVVDKEGAPVHQEMKTKGIRLSTRALDIITPPLMRRMVREISHKLFYYYYYYLCSLMRVCILGHRA
jgi:hypothetical protein